MLLEKVQNLQSKNKIGNQVKMIENSTNTELHKSTLNKYKDLLTFVYKNEGRTALITSHIRDTVCELIIDSSSGNRYEVVELINKLSKNPEIRAVLQDSKTLNFQKKLSEHSALDSSNSAIEYNSQGTLDRKPQVHTFGRPETVLLPSSSRKKLDESNSKGTKPRKVTNVHTAENSSKNSFSDKENQIDIRAVIPGKPQMF